MSPRSTIEKTDETERKIPFVPYVLYTRTYTLLVILNLLHLYTHSDYSSLSLRPSLFKSERLMICPSFLLAIDPCSPVLSLLSFSLSLRRRRRRFLVLHFFANVPSGAQLWLGILWCGYIGRFSSFLETLKTYAEATNTMPNPTAVFRRQCFGSANHPP